jgi:hypothetical protein
LVLAGKVFIIREKVDLDLLADKLKSYRVVQETRVEDQSFELISEVTDLSMGKGSLEGTFSFDQVFTIRHRGKAIPVPRTFEAPFTFDEVKDRVLLTVYEKKSRANNIANEMSKALFMSLGQVVEARIDPETLKKFHEENASDSRTIFYDDVDIPNINKLSLYGEALRTTSLYSDYLTHGKLWYVVYQSRSTGYVVGLTRNCVVTAFSKLELQDFKSYIRQEVFPLIG